jgi:hypothetical protein
MAKLTTYTLSGRITDQQNQPIEGLIVHAFDQDPKTPENPLGQPVTTDAEGKYRISFTEKDFKIGGVESGGPDVFIRVYDAEELLGESPVKRNSKKTIKIDLKVKYERQDPNEPWRRVFGVVRNEYGELIVGMTVKVYDRDLRTEQLLGSVATVEGGYEVRYQIRQFRKAEKDAADILVKVLDKAGNEIHKTNIFYNAPEELEVNINLKGAAYNGPSEWEVLTDTLTPLLEGVSPLDLREDDQFQDVSFLSGETGRSQLIIGTWITCHHLEDKTTREKSPLAAPVCFAFLRQGQPALLYDSLLQDIQHADRSELLKDKLLRAMSEISPELQRQLLEKALTDNLIPARIGADIESILETLRQIKLRYAAENTFGAGKGTIGQLLGLTPEIQREQGKFMEAFADHTGSISEFWKKLEENKTYTPTAVKSTKLHFELGALTRNHIPLVAALGQSFTDKKITEKRELAKYDRNDWVKVFKSKGPDGKKVGVPANIDGADEEEKFLQYGVILEKRFEQAYPTTAFAARLGKSDQSPIKSRTEVAQFLENNPMLYLDRYRIDHYLADNQDALKGIQDTEAVVQDLKAVQRVFKLNPTYQAVDALMSRNIKSAQQVYFMGREQLVNTLKGTGINKIESKKIYQRAEFAYAMTLTYFGNFNQAVNGVTPFGATTLTLNAEVQEKIKELPNLQTLFGSLDYCECSQCRSVYSAAAHFVDILNFLKQRKTNGNGIHAGKNVKQVLFERRADLGEIELSCENTNTPLPYIDLVNEVLEDVVSPPQPINLNNAIEVDLTSGTIKAGVLAELEAKQISISADADVYAKDSRNQWAIRDSQNAYRLFKQGGNLKILPTKQTHWTAAELRANPEYTNAAAYDKLALAVFPFNLPFDLWYIQSRAYLAHLGVSQRELFTLFQQKLADNVTLSPGELQIDCAELGIAETERKIIAGTLPGKQPWDFWGLAETGNNLAHPGTPTDSTTNVTGTWIQVLSRVSIMLHRSGLTYKELLQLLDMKYVNPSGSIFINDNADSNAANCDTTKFQIIGLTLGALNRIHRIIRLWRRLGCAMWELDRLLPDANPDPNIFDKQLNDAVLQDISKLGRLRLRFDWDWTTTQALFGDIDHSIYLDRSKNDAPVVQTLYQKLFRNKLVDAVAKFPENPALIAGTIDSQIPGILAACRIKESDFDLILKDLGLARTDALNWQILSQIFRMALLAKAIGLSVDHFVRLKRLSAPNPFATPADTLQFLEFADKVANSGITASELDFILTSEVAQGSSLPLSDKSVVTMLQGLRDGLKKIEDDIKKKPEETEESYIKSKMGLLASLSKDEEQIAAYSIIDDTWPGTPAERNTFIDNYFEGIFDLTDAKIKLAALPDGGLPLVDRLFYFQAHLEIYLLRTQEETFVKQKTGEFFQIEVPVAEALLVSLKVSGSTDSLLQHLSAERLTQILNEEYEFTLDELNFPDAFRSLRLLHKNALVVNKLGIKPDELIWWITGNKADDLSWPHPKDFPVDNTSSVPTAKWMNLSDFFAWKNSITKNGSAAFEFIDDVLDNTVSSAETITALSVLTGWEEQDISDLTGAYRWDVKQEFKKSISLLRLQKAMYSLRRLGVNAARAVEWAVPEPTASTANSLKQTVKSKYDLPQWQKVIQPLQDIFREQKRDALVSWLTAQNNPNWMDNNALYSYFLIDVEMSACMLTSRIKQAAASAQLFVQRCLMNLELDIVARAEKIVPTDTIADSKWKQWKWMKYYRVWEANRKVFLYPENWIEPELRDEKSPFFKELENELMQNDINNETAEQAYLNYLEKLDKVANLEIRTIFNEVVGQGEEVLHVFGRTRSSTGAEYYYRKRINKGRWTAWEKVELEIAGNHLIAGIHNRRLYLMWPQFLEKAVEPSSISIPTSTSGGTTQAPSRYWEIKLFWSELKKGKWTPKVLSDSHLTIYQSGTNGSHPENISLRTRLKPFIELKLFASTSPSANAPFSASGFQKIGTQILTDNIDTSPYEHLISAPSSRYQNNKLQHTSSSFYFYFSLVEETGKPHLLQSSHNAESNLVLNKIAPYLSYSVIDSKAKAFENSGGFFFLDHRRSYFVDYKIARWQEYISRNWYSFSSKSFEFFIHYHPFVELFIKELNIWGIRGLLNRQIQVSPESIPGSPTLFNFADYQPTSLVVKNYELPDKSKSYPVEDVDFSYKGAYSLYNWELFFHTPFHIANKLASNQRFEEALEWYHYIFNPTNTDNTVIDPATPQQRYWITKPFYATTKADYYKQKIENLLLAIAKGDAELKKQVEEWRDNPFNPHLIARMRTVAYQKSVLIHYIKVLIDWGDQLFRRNTMETINEATQLYILADSVLGPRPKSIPKKVVNPVKTFYQLEKEGIDVFGNALMEVENLLPSLTSGTTLGEENPELPYLDVLYFCIPNNDKLLTLWDTVADRLYKIRHCMNIEGVVQQLPLFDPPIDPSALVSAVAGGLDLSSALAEMNAPMPLYRFNFMIQRALEICNEVKSLGTAMLSALEKKDAEVFALLRSSHELSMMDLVKDIKGKQIEESLRNWESLVEGKKVTEERRDYYQKLVNDKWNAWEITAFTLSSASTVIDIAIATGYVLAGGLKLIPNFKAGAAGFGGTPTVGVSTGGGSIGGAAEMVTRTLQSIATALEKSASLATTVANYNRRSAEWEYQIRLAEKEVPQIDKQITAAKLRHDIANLELRNHDRQKENQEKEYEYMQTKFTNRELYDWMINQISTVYFQSYQLAYDIAKRAERCFRYELGLSDSNYIQFGYWDSLKKGLLSGEKLYYDLKRLETAYYEQNRREYELTKHISLAQVDPVALLQLRQSGQCIVNIPEIWFDMDYPGHYFRRIKSVSLSIPCIAGSYTTVGCTLTLSSNKLRKDSTLLGGKYERDLTNDDPRFRDEIAAIQSIATSSAQKDSGLFELSFRDERYLPFEGAGAISTWQIKLNSEFRQFDFNTISDVLIHLNYTARESGGEFKVKANEALKNNLKAIALEKQKNGLFRVYDVKREFSTQWHKFLHPAVNTDDQVLILENLQDKLPYFTKVFQHKKVSNIEIAALMKDSGLAYKVMVSPLGNTDADLLDMTSDNLYQGLHHAAKELVGAEVDLNTWTIQIKEAGATDFRTLPSDAIEELFLIVQYTVS